MNAPRQLPNADAGGDGTARNSAPLFAPGLYGMIDPAVLVPGGADAALHAEAVRQGTLLLEEGVRTLQLRIKGVPSSRRLAILADLAAVSDRLGLRRDGPCWIINDDITVAHRADAPRWFAHLGQDDGPDPEVPFGRSTHTLAQVSACGTATYIGFGPVFGTVTKDTGYDARGTELLLAAVRASPVPVVAIGGITLDTLASVQSTGVHAWAVIGAIWRAPDPRAAIRRFVRAAETPEH